MLCAESATVEGDEELFSCLATQRNAAVAPRRAKAMAVMARTRGKSMPGCWRARIEHGDITAVAYAREDPVGMRVMRGAEPQRTA